MVMESDSTVQFDQCTNTICIIIILQKHVFHHNFLTTLQEYDADLSVKDNVMITKEHCVCLGSKALV